MKNDIGKISFDELNHFVGVFHQMGRLPLDSDFNEQNELILRLLQRAAGDAISTGSPNEGWRIDTHRLLDRMDQRAGWVATPAAATLFVDYFDHRVGDGSLVALGATRLDKALPRPLDMSGIVELMVSVSKTPAAACTVEVGDGTLSHAFTMSAVATEPGGWTLLRALPGAWPAGFAVQAVTRIAFTGLDPGVRYGFDAIKADLPLLGLFFDPEWLSQASATPAAAQLAADDDQRCRRHRSLRASQATAALLSLPQPMDLSRARALVVYLRRTPAAAPITLRLLDATAPAANFALAGASISTEDGWERHRFVLPHSAGFDWAQVAQLEASGLSGGATYRFGVVLAEVDARADLVIMGGDGTLEGAGRFYADGRCAAKESHGSYFSQADLRQADPAALATVPAGRRRIDYAYLDVWERPLSFAERPALRDVALDGLDTCTRTQLVAQVRLLRGTEVDLATTAVPPAAAFAALPRIGLGVLSTKDNPAAVLDPCADPCEPVITGTYLGEENRLFRVEIHRAGDIGVSGAAGTASFKWSRENAGNVTPLVADALAGDTSALVERPELYAVGDLIELADDFVELATGPVEDRIGHRAHQRGELRRIVTVNLQTRRIGWADATVVNPLLLPFHAALPRTLWLAQHAKLSRWDGSAACTPGDIVLADGVVIEFGGQGLVAGDHWLFATRSADRSVERLIESPPRGTVHSLYLLAAIHRSRDIAPAEQIVFCEDLRPRFAPLAELDASRVAYDPGAGIGALQLPEWAEVGTVQQAIDALVRADQGASQRLHHQLLHGMGVICGLKLRCVRSNREQIVMTGGYALDCEGELLHNAGDVAVPLVQRARAQGLLNAADTGRVDLWIEPAANGVSTHLRGHANTTIWEEILEGSLLKDFFENTVLALYLEVKANLSPFPDANVPVAEGHRRAMALLNLFWQKINAATGPYLFLSRAEHDLLASFHADLLTQLASRSGYCAMFDHLQVFPAYPYALPTGIETAFGTLQMHRRLRMHPSGRWVASCGVGNRVQVYDLQRQEAVVLSTFPAAANVDLQDLAFNAAGTELYAVATLAHGTHVDSVFATATWAPPAAPATAPTLSWGSARVICDMRFVTLLSHAAQPNRLFAIGRSDTAAALRGLYVFDPALIPLAPTPSVIFNATGLLAVDGNGIAAVASEHSGGVQTGAFDRLRRIDLTTLATSTPFNAIGRASFGDVPVEDLRVVDGIVFATATSAGQTALLRFTLASNTAQTPVLLGSSNGIWRLAPLPSRNALAITDMVSCRARLFDTALAVLQPGVRLPLQIFPIAAAVTPAERQVVVLNYLSNSLSLVDINTVISGAQSFTAEPPVTLAVYRDEMLRSFTDLAGVLLQYFKDGFCDQFLVDCPTCGPEDRVYLGTIEITAGRVQHICNFSGRHYAKSFRTWGYWLSAMPLLSMVKALFARFCCLKLVP